jgi:multimeric flavodoxin WrbA
VSDHVKVTAVVGSYRKGGIIDTTIDEILSSAREEGAETSKIYLIDKRIEFCTNCRTCTQLEGTERGECIIEDDMNGILDELHDADAIVLGSPMNFGTVTAVTKTFIERLVCCAYWPWGVNAPQIRDGTKNRYSVVVASSAAPSPLARLSSRIVKLLKDAAGLLGARTIGVLFVGLAGTNEQQAIGERTKSKARRLGKRLAERKAVKSNDNI